MIELKCPECEAVHWELDADYPGMSEPFIEYSSRPYKCPSCGRTGVGYIVGQKSPPEFILQPHPMYPMTEDEFGYWMRIYETHFPERARRHKPHLP